MNKNPWLVIVCTFLALGTISCQPNPHDSGTAEEASTRPTASQTETSSNPAATESNELTYEPAYPTDVSTEGLDAEDIARQTTHSHGDESDHSHDGEEGHGDDEHDH